MFEELLLSGVVNSPGEDGKRGHTLYILLTDITLPDLQHVYLQPGHEVVEHDKVVQPVS